MAARAVKIIDYGSDLNINVLNINVKITPYNILICHTDDARGPSKLCNAKLFIADTGCWSSFDWFLYRDDRHPTPDSHHEKLPATATPACQSANN